MRLLKERPKHITLALISEETGLQKCWLDSLLYSKRKDEIDPGVRRIETLYNYLADEPFTFERPVFDQHIKD